MSVPKDFRGEERGKKILGKVRLIDKEGNEVTELLTHGIKVRIVGVDDAIIKSIVVDDKGQPLTSIEASLVSSLPSGENRIGVVSGSMGSVYVKKSLAAAGDYAAEDVLSESATAGTVWTFPKMARKKGGSGFIYQAIAMCSVTNLAFRLTLYLFNRLPTSVKNDNVANTAVLDGDAPNHIGLIDFETTEDLGGDSESLVNTNTSGKLPLGYVCDKDDDALYGILVTRDAIAGEAAGMNMHLTLFMEQL